MIDEPKRPRDELAERIAKRDLDEGSALIAIATVLLTDVLPTLERISKKLESVNTRLHLDGFVFPWVDAIYGYLMAMVKPGERQRMEDRRVQIQGMLERTASELQQGRKQ